MKSVDVMLTTIRVLDPMFGEQGMKIKARSDEDPNVEWIDRDTRTGRLHVEVYELANKNYKRMLEAGVAPEQARMILPQSMMTEWYWSGTLYAFARVCNLRCAKDTQLESRIVADQIDELAQEHFPISWKHLRNSMNPRRFILNSQATRI